MKKLFTLTALLFAFNLCFANIDSTDHMRIKTGLRNEILNYIQQNNLKGVYTIVYEYSVNSDNKTALLTTVQRLDQLNDFENIGLKFNIDNYQPNTNVRFVFNIYIESEILKVKTKNNKKFNSEIIRVTANKGKYIIRNYTIYVNKVSYNKVDILRYKN